MINQNCLFHFFVTKIKLVIIETINFKFVNISFIKLQKEKKRKKKKQRRLMIANITNKVILKLK